MVEIPARAANPVLVEVTRGDLVESRHRGAVAAVDSGGNLVFATGAVDAPVFPRSAIKPLQALALLESGAADAFGLGDDEIALACASHTAEPRHVEIVTAWLKRIGCSEADLECGPEPPRTDSAARGLLREGRGPSAVDNNCSGKHAGFLTVARHLNEPVTGYIRPGHPVQRMLRKILSEVFETDLEAAQGGIDGCGIPVHAVPLVALARGIARLADPKSEPVSRKSALLRISRAMEANPFLIAGTGRFGTRVMEAARGRVLVKGGAEGVYCAALPGLGLALKIDDGANRAAETAMGGLLRRFGVFGEAEAAGLAEVFESPIFNWVGTKVGSVRPAPELLAGWKP